MPLAECLMFQVEVVNGRHVIITVCLQEIRQRVQEEIDSAHNL
jgi:hypothetical protein